MFLPIVLLVLAAIVALWTLGAVGGLLVSLVWWGVVGLITGWVASRLTGARLNPGWTILTGVAGSWLGGALLTVLHLHAFGPVSLLLHFAASVLGAAILITFARVVARPSLTGGARPRLGRTY